MNGLELIIENVEDTKGLNLTDMFTDSLNTVILDYKEGSTSIVFDDTVWDITVHKHWVWLYNRKIGKGYKLTCKDFGRIIIQ